MSFVFASFLSHDVAIISHRERRMEVTLTRHALNKTAPDASKRTGDHRDAQTATGGERDDKPQSEKIQQPLQSSNAAAAALLLAIVMRWLGRRCQHESERRWYGCRLWRTDYRTNSSCTCKPDGGRGIAT
jgi:hypothetical protein